MCIHPSTFVNGYVERLPYFIAGLPRSGSTLLINLLAQNPDFKLGATSVLPQLLSDIKNSWHTLPLTKTMSETDSYVKLKAILNGLLSGFYQDTTQTVIFDKSRTWPSLIETLIELGYQPQILATVRDVREIVASFEKLYSKSLALGAPTQLLANPQVMQNPDTRLNYWLGGDAPLGSSYNTLLDAFRRGHTDRIHIVRFEDFTTYPAQTLHEIYEWLELPHFEHDVKNVTQTIFEDDRPHGFRDLHKIHEGAIKPVKTTWQQILPKEFAEKIAGQNFWNNPI